MATVMPCTYTLFHDQLHVNKNVSRAGEHIVVRQIIENVAYPV